MTTTGQTFQTMEDYIGYFPENVQIQLQMLRQTIRKTAPDAQETISYQIPTFKLNGNLVHFTAFKNHNRPACCFLHPISGV